MIVTGRRDVRTEAPGIEIDATACSGLPAPDPASPLDGEAAILVRLRLGGSGPVDVDLLRSRRPLPAVMRRVHPATWKPAVQRAGDGSAQPAGCVGCGMILAATTRFCRRCGTSRAAAS